MGRSGLKRANGKASIEREGVNNNRPGWKGPGFQKPKEKPKPAKAQTKNDPSESDSLIPLELQQLLLNIFKDVFEDVLAGEGLKETLQEVKGALFERDFERAFGKKEFLEGYSVRWSPSRALCYQSILVDIYDHLRDLLPKAKQQNKPLRAVCFGGGAAEVIAFGGFLRYLGDTSSPKPSQQQADPVDASSSPSEDQISQSLQDATLTPSETLPLLSLHLLDIANWDSVVQKLHQGLITAPPLPKYASATVIATNASLLDSTDISTKFTAEDVLSLSHEQIQERFGLEPMLVTLLFTLNELYTFSISKTTAFLLKLTMAAQKGTLLLVVDSPGSYSETKIGTDGGEGKKYPMKWLMDHALLDAKKPRAKVLNGKEVESEEGTEGAANWEKIEEDDSRWFRLAESLRYPIPLENMRYQIHLYRRL